MTGEAAGEGRCAVIGAGYTGLHAAIETARAGLDTVVIDAEAAGWGCSTRNGGQISTSVKPSFATLRQRYGEGACRSLKEGQASLDHVAGFIRDERKDRLRFRRGRPLSRRPHARPV
jgi:glycine/D-amino acid oxidase-like deaminating enzyme